MMHQAALRHRDIRSTGAAVLPAVTRLPEASPNHNDNHCDHNRNQQLI